MQRFLKCETRRGFFLAASYGMVCSEREVAVRTFGLMGLVSFAVACGTGNPCDEYAELLCDCAETDDDCDGYRLQFENADADQQDECSARLDEAEADAETCQESEQEG